jgi:hypothetical protein
MAVLPRVFGCEEGNLCNDMTLAVPGFARLRGANQVEIT